MPRSPEDYNSKLFLTRDIENHPNFEGIKVVEQIDEELGKLPTYVGTRYWGSEIKGYSDPAISDIDTLLLYDITQPNDDPSSYNPEDTLLKRALNLESKLAESTGRSVAIKSIPVSIEEIQNNISQNNYQFAANQIAHLSGLVKGEKVTEYRNNITEIINALSSEQRTEMVRQDGAAEKWQARTGFTNEQMNEILEKRKEHYRKRLEKLYETTKDA